jgi:hypothetical protein
MMDTEKQKSLNGEQRIIGCYHYGPGFFLLSAPPVTSLKGAPIERAQILDMREKKLFAVRPLVSITARVPFDAYTGDQSILPGLLEQVEEVDD